MIGEKRPDGQWIATEYDDHGNLKGLTPPGQPKHVFGHNEVDLLSQYDPPCPGSPTDYVVNEDRLLDYVTRPDLKTIDPEYSATDFRLKSLTTLGELGEIWDYEYDAATGQLTAVKPDPMSAYGVEVGYGYLGHLLEEMSWGGAVDSRVLFGYDDDFRVNSVGVGTDPANAALPEHEVFFTYDDDGLLETVGDLVIDRDGPTGFLNGTTLGDTTDLYVFDLDYAELDRYRAFDSGGELYFEEVTARDLLGRITERIESMEGGDPKTFGYEYDDAGRLKKVTVGPNIVEQYLYDANGNRTAVQSPLTNILPNQVPPAIVVDVQDRLVQYGDLTYTYTDNGELATKVQDEVTVGYTYDEYGNLLQVDLTPDTGIVVDYLVDGHGRRVAKKVGGAIVTRWIYKDHLNRSQSSTRTGISGTSSTRRGRTFRTTLSSRVEQHTA